MSRWRPMREFDRLFSDFLGTPLAEYRDEPGSWYLPLDIVDRRDAFEVKAPVPGFKPEEVEVTVHNGMLNIKAEQKQESETKEATTCGARSATVTTRTPSSCRPACSQSRICRRTRESRILGGRICRRMRVLQGQPAEGLRVSRLLLMSRPY